MSNIITVVMIALTSIAFSFSINRNLKSHYFLEEYYFVQNLDANNEKNTETLRQKIQQLMQKNIPARYRPSQDKFQCFKIISESVFFCSADTYRKSVAERMKTLMQETIPNEVGWIDAGDAEEKVSGISGEIRSNQALITDMSKQLEAIKKKNTKQASQEKKLSKTNELYKKNLTLLKKKLDVLHELMPIALNPDTRANYKLMQEETQVALETVEQEYAGFKSQNGSFAEAAEQKDALEDQINQLKESNAKLHKDLTLIQQTIEHPNDIGKVADLTEFQLISDPERQRFDAQKKDSNLIWFAVSIFFILTNFVFRLKPNNLVPFEDDATMTEGIIT